MCGIAGIIDYNQKTVPVQTVNRMLTRIKHRGPDESGILSGDFVGIGNVRLSIIDISSGQQPLCDESGRYWIVYNGEVFNYVELREELDQKGVKFKTQSDTEVIVQLYAIYKEKAVNKLNGQFAFAIWDTQEKELFIARDRMGIRPVFYYYRDNQFTFGSEIKAIFENGDVPASIDAKGLAQVFTYWTTITPNTVFENVYEIPPAHYLKLNKDGISVNRYWSLDFSQQKTKEQISFQESIEQLDDLFKDAVKLRLRADVQVAAYLSGGIDSSITTSYIKQVEPGVLNTFSIGFSEKEFDESAYQNEASKYFNTNHTGITCTSREIAEYFPEVVWHTEIPILRTAPVPMYALSKLVRENNIKVVITGEGADEMFAGYNIFKESEVRRFWSRQPGSKFRPLLLKKLYPYIPQLQNANPQALKFFFGYKLGETNSPYYSHLLRWNNTSHIQKHFSKDISDNLNGYNPYNLLEDYIPKNLTSWKTLSQSQWIEASIFMSGYLLSSQGDRMAMANSVEGRYPFLDYRIIEFAASLPSEYKLNGLNEKYILKRLIKGKIPDSILNRSKQAYRAPIISTFLNPDAPEYVKELLSGQSLKSINIFNAGSVTKLIEKAKKTRPSEVESMTLAGILSTHLLHQFYIKKTKGILKESELLNSNIINV